MEAVSLAGLGALLYQALFLLFIGLHLLLATAITFGAGLYTGLYVAQNYEVPNVDDPAKILENIRIWAEQYRKKD